MTRALTGSELYIEPKAVVRVAAKPFWNPYAVGVLLGLVLLATYAITGALVVALIVAYAIRLAVQAGSVVPEARMRRALRFGELSTIRVIAGLAETALKLGLAYLGAHGRPELRVWCFALGPVANTAITTLAIQLRCSWRPRLAFDRVRARQALGFTAALSGGELLYYAYTSADYLVIGAVFGTAAVGEMQQHHEPGRAFDQGPDGGLLVAADDQVAFPVAGHGPVGGLGGAFADHHHVLDAPGVLAVAAGAAPGPPGAQAASQLPAQLTAALDV